MSFSIKIHQGWTGFFRSTLIVFILPKEEKCLKKQQPKKPETPYVGQDLIKFGAKGPQIGNILSQIVGKTKEEAQEIIKNVLGNQDVVFERKRWIKSIAQWKNKIKN